MLRIIKFEKYRFLKIKSCVVIIIILSIIINNGLSLFFYKNQFLKMNGNAYLESIEEFGQLIPLLIMIFVGLMQDGMIKSNHHLTEIMCGNSLRKILLGKSIFYTICYLIVVELPFLIEFVLFSKINGINALSLSRILIQNLCYIIGVFTVIVFTLYIIYLFNNAAEGVIISCLIYITLFVISNVASHLIIEYKELSIDYINWYLLSGIFPEYFCEEAEHAASILLLGQTIINLVIRYILVEVVFKIVKIKKYN